MITGGNLALVNAGEEPPRRPAKQMELDTSILRSSAIQLAQTIGWVPGARKSHHLRDRGRTLSHDLKVLFRQLQSPPAKNMSDGVRLLRENNRLFHGELEGVCETAKLFQKNPQVRTSTGTVIPRTAALAGDYLAATGYQFSEASFTSYIEAFQETTVLNMDELWAMVAALKLVLLEQVVDRGRRLLKEHGRARDLQSNDLQSSDLQSDDLQNVVRSLREVAQTSWKVVIEPLIPFDRILREDPAETYSRMDYESRDLYRKKLVNIADHSDWTESDVASEAVALAREARKHPNADPRVSLRKSHIGTYLLAEGTRLLESRVDFRPPVIQRLRTFLRNYPNEFYLPAIGVVTIAIVVSAVVLLTEPSTPLGLILLSALALLLPSSQSAVQMVNYLVTSFLPPQILPKLDFSEGLPNDCITVVAIPTLLLDEKQVRKLADDLEVRFLGNHDPNLHFALLTDLPDSPTDPDENNPLVDLCSDLIQELNEKYAEKGMGSFFLFHRHRAYNPRERLWMGWERKRGKLMDLNKLLRGHFDSFPVKVGNFSILPSIRFVITLDCDTELPRGAARRMVGTLAHILNQAIIDPERGVVTAGYGILQPRVGVSIQSSVSSRLANISSGQTGLDIYTRAASDVYQDLYGEGIFVGKGIYEVETLHRVLDRRFPRNALLSHDLIEGAYARAGLVSDIEVIEDYPSHYSAYYRRKHRWLRGDWQIAGWLRPLVPDEAGEQVSNPLSAISEWKILDNLRRSLVEPAFFVLFVLGWTCLPGHALEWTLTALAILFLPAFFQFGFELAQAAVARRQAAVVDALNGFVNACVADLLTVAFLAHQALLSVDAMVRTMVRRVITRQRLLQWETAAQAQLSGYKRTALDSYLNWTPALALGLFLLVGMVKRGALPVAVPILLLWAFSQPLSLWLNRPPRAARKRASEKNRWFLRLAALRTWRYFAEFSTQEHNWLIPDNVQEDPARIAPRISPTNLGFLLNARQVACEFGYLTVPEFAQQTLQTLATVSRLQRHRGHLLNWYDTRSLEPLEPKFVSTVDSGNLMASLWTLEQACQQLLKRPLLQPELQSGFLDHLYVLMTIGVLPRRKFTALKKAFGRENWQQRLLDVPDTVSKSIHQPPSRQKYAADARWFQEQTEERIREFGRTVQEYAPWLLPKFSALKDDPAIHSQVVPKVDLQLGQALTVEQIPDFIDQLAGRLQRALDSSTAGESKALYQELRSLLPAARAHAVGLIEDLKTIAKQAGAFADEMDFEFLLNRGRGLLSVGFDVPTQHLHAACYDLLASEARIAFFTAIAKDDIPQDSWFQLGRAQALDHGIANLLSWTGTMFEYLMPALWMRIYPNTLLERAVTASVQSQRTYADNKGIPWGISESACCVTDEAGNYQYYAFGVPQIAIHKVDQEGPVVSPYSTFLALSIDSPAALRNLRYMRSRQALGPYGFYEALDYNSARCRSRFRSFELVRCWMAHHQGMSLLAIANFLHEDVVQQWFHSHPRVQATELLLQEKPAARPRPQKSRDDVA